MLIDVDFFCKKREASFILHVFPWKYVRKNLTALAKMLKKFHAVFKSKGKQNF